MQNYPPMFTLLEPDSSHNSKSCSATKVEINIKDLTRYYLSSMLDEIPEDITTNADIWSVNLALLEF